MISYIDGRYPKLVVNDQRLKVMARLGSIPGVELTGGIVVLPAEPRLYEIMVEELNVPAGESAQAWYEKIFASEQAIANRLVASKNFQHPKQDTLRPYQIIGVEFLRHVGRAVLADDMGLGKTAETIITVDVSPRHRRILVVCPNSVKMQWAAEIAKWSSRPDTPVIVLNPKTAKKQLEDYVEGWLILNYHNLRAYKLPFIQWDWAVFDEAHFMVNRKTKTVDRAKHIAAANMLMLTGTPIGNSPDDLWSLLNILYPRRFTSYWRFFELFVDYEEDFFGTRTIRGTKNVEYLRRELATVMLRRLKSEVGVEIPPKTVQTIQLEMTAEQAKYYQDMALRYVAEVQETGERITALAEIAVITRLRQILSTPYTIGFPDTSGKLDAAMELIQGTDQQIVVFSMFKGTIEALGNRLTQENIPYAMITGDIKAEERDAARHALDAGEIQVLLCTLGAGGVGLNLQAASVAIFIEHHWNPREQKQAEDRIHRLGQKNPVTIYNLMCVASIDSAVAGVLARKQKMSDDILKEALVAELERFHPGIRQKLDVLYAL